MTDRAQLGARWMWPLYVLSYLTGVAISVWGAVDPAVRAELGNSYWIVVAVALLPVFIATVDHFSNSNTDDTPEQATLTDYDGDE